MIDDLEANSQDVTPENQPQVAEVTPVNQPEPVKIDSNKEYNMRVMRERAMKAEQRAQELERALQTKLATKEEEPDDDSLVEKRHLRKYDSEIGKVTAELESTKKKLEQFTNSSIEMHLRSKFNDFDTIVTDENMERLAREKPAMYRSILSNPDLKDKGETAYEAIVTYLQPGKFSEQEKKLAENKAKPKNAATVAPQASDSPLARAGDYDRRILTEERKAELRKEMEDAKSRY
jgi:hypothetical protein